jgi:hypothetical protein
MRKAVNALPHFRSVLERDHLAHFPARFSVKSQPAFSSIPSLAKFSPRSILNKRSVTRLSSACEKRCVSLTFYETDQ